ncbi:uncharacterized protein ARMOST_14134 [Armillaria ostoyae]|uniref:Uncharacterized protein n=1 Tax=Armillaria ostoyae TaxID=47428 RepID=A0A284RPR4_ARMOS|nr:uncharacterized protein ARMOST_14134 [Armillaria ostoyae]
MDDDDETTFAISTLEYAHMRTLAGSNSRQRKLPVCPSPRTCSLTHTGYIAEGSEPKLPPGMRQLLHEDLNKSFDF